MKTRNGRIYTDFITWKIQTQESKSVKEKYKENKTTKININNKKIILG